jgi:hypothetical protein
MVTDLQHEWEVEQDDFGGPLIFHRHAAANVPAYVIGGDPERRVAQCSECLKYLEFADYKLERSLAE